MRHTARLCVFSSVVVLLVACSGSKGEQRGGASKGNVGVRAARVDMKEARFTGAQTDLVLVVDNQTNRTLTIEGAEVEVSYAGGGAGSEGDSPSEAKTFKGAMETRGKATVEPGGTAEVPVEVELIYPAEPGAFLQFTQASVQRLKVVGTVHTTGGELAVNDETDFPAPKLLQGQVKDAQMASIDDGAAGECTLELVLFNPNQFPVKTDRWNLKIWVADKEIKETDVGVGENVMANAGVGYSESIKIDKENWGADYKQVLKRSTVPYKVVGSIKVGDVTYPSEAAGEMKFHR